jgi:spore coat protein A
LKIDRREMLRLGLLTSAGLLSGSGVEAEKWMQGQAHSHGEMGAHARANKVAAAANAAKEAGAKPVSLAPYVDTLPRLPVIHPYKAGQSSTQGGGAAEGSTQNGGVVQVRMREILTKVHRDLPATRMWGYNGTWPGPTFEARSGQPISVKWMNELPTKHFLAIDPSIHGAEEGTPEVRTVTHVHGAKVLPEHDGYPEAWFTSGGKTGPTFDAKPNQYPNDQAACTLWYHDHALGITRLNVVAGLAGLYIIRDDEEDALNLPSGDYEIPLLIQDRSFLPD